MSFRILSCRAPVIMPNGYTVQRFNLDKFGPLVELVEDGEDHPHLETWENTVLFDFEGFNRECKGWQDSTLAKSHELDSRLYHNGFRGEFVAGLWPCGDNGLGFGAARDRAELAAKRHYAPFIQRLVSSGFKVVLVGHSCGGAMVYWIAEFMGKAGMQVSAAIMLNAALRQSEVTPAHVCGAKKWINFHSSEDSALKLMQRSLADEHGSILKGLWAWLSFKNVRDEKIVGMHGLPVSGIPAEIDIKNIDLTQEIHSAHGAAHTLPKRTSDLAIMRQIVLALDGI